MTNLREIAAYLKGAHQYESSAAVEAAARWREDVETLMGQQGLENLSTMLKILEAAREWGKERGTSGGSFAVSDKLLAATRAYEDMVLRRGEE